ncbi:MAG: diguanylate cyclase [Rhodocyclaceae bacterium]|nr:diguanylate cyclase [Rhodocyclaceae bacterium]MDZ4213659.1 diguanylate cyclase [Rhodocyclaceae bacterium]
MIGAGFGVVVVLLIAMTVVTMVRLERIQLLVAEINTQHSKHVQFAHRMYHAARERSYVLVKLVHEDDALVADDYAMRFWALGNEVAQTRRLLIKETLTPEEHALLGEQARATELTVPLQERVIELNGAQRRRDAMMILTDQALPAQEGVLSALTAFIALKNRQIERASLEASEQVRSAQVVLFSAMLLTVLASLAIGFYVQRNMSRMMRGLTDKTWQLNVSLRDLDFQKQALDEHAIVSIADPQGRITYVNDKFCAVSQYAREELIGRDHRIINSGQHPPSMFVDMWRMIASGATWQGEVCNRKKDGSLYWVSTTILPFLNAAGRPEHYISVRTDITSIKMAEMMLESNQERLEELVAQRTAELAEREAAFQRLSETDMLTGVANRRKFDETLLIETSRAQRHGLSLMLVMLDIDHFKKLNDTYGHQVGDSVLVEFAQRLASHIRAHDFLARWGGEEFAVLATLNDSEDPRQFADKLRALIAANEFSVVGHVTASLGLSIYRPDEDIDALLSRADKALYAAKANGRNRVEVTP